VTAKIEGQAQVTGGAQIERLRVLLVDDNASVLRFLASAFSSNHCQVTTASTAEQALEQLGDDPFDLVVSDIKMPGLSGLDKTAVEVDDRPELESLSFPKDGLSRQWLEFLSQLGATK